MVSVLDYGSGGGGGGAGYLGQFLVTKVLNLLQLPYSPKEILFSYTKWAFKVIGGGGGITWVSFCWVCVAGIPKPLAHYSLFLVYFVAH